MLPEQGIFSNATVTLAYDGKTAVIGVVANTALEDHYEVDSFKRGDYYTLVERNRAVFKKIVAEKYERGEGQPTEFTHANGFRTTRYVIHIDSADLVPYANEMSDLMVLRTAAQAGFF